MDDDIALPRSVRLADAQALRAYAHPVRMALLSLLRANGPTTATEAAEVVGESPSNCSFHLRQLAKYGLVEETGGGRGRSRPWRATAMLTSWDHDDPEVAGAAGALDLAVARRYHELTTAWVTRRDELPADWRNAAQFGDTLLHLTPDELAELGRRTRELLAPYLDRLDDPARRPENARPVSVLHLAFPVLDGPP